LKKIIHDCDNTMGVAGCDVDDGLAFLYLLGRKDIEILGITTVFGNSDLETVYATTSAMMDELGMKSIPVKKGCPDRKDRKSEAARYIVDEVNAHEGDISILATGPLTNLYAAYLLDNTVFEKVNEIVLMGGVTESLIINGRNLDELNLSCDPEATLTVLKKGRNVTVITGNNCLDAFFPQKEFDERLSSNSGYVTKYIMEKCGPWFKRMNEAFGIDGFHNWDVVAAVYLAEPTLFQDHRYSFEPILENLKNGFLTGSRCEHSSPCTINMPRIADTKRFSDEVYRAWLS
jgi:purine nucleosidase